MSVKGDKQKIIAIISSAFDNEIVDEEADQPEFYSFMGAIAPGVLRIGFVDRDDNVRAVYVLTIMEEGKP
jgi:hypothetical protein